MIAIIRCTIRTRYRIITTMTGITARQGLAVSHINISKVCRIMTSITIVCCVEGIMLLTSRDCAVMATYTTAIYFIMVNSIGWSKRIRIMTGIAVIRGIDMVVRLPNGKTTIMTTYTTCISRIMIHSGWSPTSS
jgi:hypothetical protein